MLATGVKTGIESGVRGGGAERDEGSAAKALLCASMKSRAESRSRRDCSHIHTHTHAHTAAAHRQKAHTGRVRHRAAMCADSVGVHRVHVVRALPLFICPHRPAGQQGQYLCAPARIGRRQGSPKGRRQPQTSCQNDRWSGAAHSLPCPSSIQRPPPAPHTHTHTHTHAHARTQKPPTQGYAETGRCLSFGQGPFCRQLLAALSVRCVNAEQK
jgi:hypothetical protein